MIDHTVAIDAARRLVFDPAEKRALRFQPGTLEACVGDGVNLERLEEVRELRLQELGQSSKVRHGKTPEQRKRKRENRRRREAEARQVHTQSYIPLFLVVISHV